MADGGGIGYNRVKMGCFRISLHGELVGVLPGGEFLAEAGELAWGEFGRDDGRCHALGDDFSLEINNK